MSEFIDPYAEAVRLHEKVAFLEYILETFYECAGPANDSILRQLKRDWVYDGRELPLGYELEDKEPSTESVYGHYVGGVKVE